ncbi:MAG: flagellar export chaperone FliS [Desulfobacteraceae bacterium]|nr:MAG: flagellar export chaperone FliS [Desulfobacteraceae bacterium]
MYGNRIGAYRKNDVITADSKTLVVMCYDALITNLKLAKVKYSEKEYEAKEKAVTKSMNVITALMEALDFAKGGQIAKNLDAIYSYMLRRITYADVNKDMAVFDELIRIAEELGGAWKEIFGKNRIMGAGEKSVSDTLSASGRSGAVSVV